MPKIAQKSTLPTPEQIAELHALSLEIEKLANQLNYFPNMVLTLLTLLFIDAIFPRPDEAGYLRIARLFFILYALVFSYEKIASAMLLAFPNGISQSRTYHSGIKYKTQRQLGTQKEVSLLLSELKALIRQQKLPHRVMFGFIGIHIFLALCAIAFDSSALEEMNITRVWQVVRQYFHFHSFGLSFGIEKTGIVELDNLALLMNNLEALSLSQALYQQWSNFQFSKQLREYKSQLEYISCLPSGNNWEVMNGLEDATESVVLSLKPFSQEITFLSQSRIHLTIPREIYFAELYRIFLEEKIPVYYSSAHQIFVGFAKRSKKDSEGMRERLMERILHIRQNEKQRRDIVTKLNNMPSEMTTVREPWDYYYAHDLRGKPAPCYYLNVHLLREEYRNTYVKHLTKIIPEENLSFEKNIIALRNIQIENLTTLKINMISSISSKRRVTQKEDDSCSLTEYPVECKKKKSVSTKKQQAPSISTIPRIRLSPLPDKLDFGNGIVFFTSLPENKKPKNFAYPMSVPWLPKGKAYGSLDPDVFNAVRKHLDKKQVLAPLENGEVHGNGKGHHNKAGATGIQGTDEPYRNVHGETFMESNFKLKYTNNIRIFGRKTHTITNCGEQYIHYRFDGPAFGH